MNITEQRLARRLSVAELARRAGVPEPDLEEVEAASGEMLIDTLSSIAQALDVDVAVLFRPRTNDVH
jgi:transcriptional regulator with XRE-family HTH domain